MNKCLKIETIRKCIKSLEKMWKCAKSQESMRVAKNREVSKKLRVFYKKSKKKFFDDINNILVGQKTYNLDN
jgi:hypothetical protein